MSTEIVERVLRSSRYRDIDRGVVSRLADEELPRSRNADDAVKRVKRRLHQAVGAFRGERRSDLMGLVRSTWHGDMLEPAFRDACARVMAAHASTAERVAFMDRFYDTIWSHTGVPLRVLDVGCGLAPLALPWMGLEGTAWYVATDVDRRPLGTVEEFLALVGQPKAVRAEDAVTHPPRDRADVALLLKLVPTLDRQDPRAAERLLRAVEVTHAVVSFPVRSLAGRSKGMERTYRARIEQLAGAAGRVTAVAEASVPNELVFVLTLDG